MCDNMFSFDKSFRRRYTILLIIYINIFVGPIMVRISWWKSKIIKSQKYKYQRRGRYKNSSADNKAYVKYWIIVYLTILLSFWCVHKTVSSVNKGRNIFSIILSKELKLSFLHKFTFFVKGHILHQFYRIKVVSIEMRKTNKTTFMRWIPLEPLLLYCSQEYFTFESFLYFIRFSVANILNKITQIKNLTKLNELERSKKICAKINIGHCAAFIS